MIFGAQAPQVERHAAAGVPQLVAMARSAVVPVQRLARLDLRGIGTRMGHRRERDKRK